MTDPPTAGPPRLPLRRRRPVASTRRGAATTGHRGHPRQPSPLERRGTRRRCHPRERRERPPRSHDRAAPLPLRLRTVRAVARAAQPALRCDRHPRGARKPGHLRGPRARAPRRRTRSVLPVQRREPPQALPRCRSAGSSGQRSGARPRSTPATRRRESSCEPGASVAGCATSVWVSRWTTSRLLHPTTENSTSTDDPLRVGYVGRLDERKGVLVLLDAVERVEHASLSYVGAGAAEPMLARADHRCRTLEPGHHPGLRRPRGPSLAVPRFRCRRGAVAHHTPLGRAVRTCGGRGLGVRRRRGGFGLGLAAMARR